MKRFENLKSKKPSTHREDRVYHAEIERGQWVRIFGHCNCAGGNVRSVLTSLPLQNTPLESLWRGTWASGVNAEAIGVLGDAMEESGHSSVDIVRACHETAMDGQGTLGQILLPFDKTFRIGDMAEFDRYNLIYYAPITAIGNTTVTIHREHRGHAHRLNLHAFAWRNWDFDLAIIKKHNEEWYD